MANLPMQPNNNNNGKQPNWQGFLIASALLLFFNPALLPIVATMGAVRLFTQAVATNNTNAQRLRARQIEQQEQKQLKDAQNNFLRTVAHAPLSDVLRFTRQNPNSAFNCVQRSLVYKDYFNRVISSGVAELADSEITADWKAESSTLEPQMQQGTVNVTTSVTGRLLPYPQQEENLARILSTHFVQMKSLFGGRFRSPSRKLFFDVALSGYICFFADLFTPDVYLGPSFLRTYTRYIYSPSSTMGGVPPASRDPRFVDMFITSYQSYITVLQDFRERLQDPEAFLIAYAELFLRSLEMSSVGDVLKTETIELTASILPLCENGLEWAG